MSPQAIPAGIALAGAQIGGAAAIAGAVAAAYGSQIIARGSNNGNQLPGSTTVAIKQPDAPRQLVYGQTMVAGVPILISSSDDDIYTHIIQALASHECEAIGDIYLNDNLSDEYGSYGKKPRATVTWGGTDGTTSYQVVAVPATLEVTVNGTSYTDSNAVDLAAQLVSAGYVATGSDVEDQEVRFEVYADTSTIEITVDDIEDTLTVSSTNGRVVQYVGEEYPVITRYGLGASAQTANADMISYIPEWTADHRLRGIAYVYARLRLQIEAFPNGLPNIKALVTGKNDIYDPRSGGSYGYTNNAALCVADFLSNSKFGFGAAYGTEIDETALIAAANECDESVTANWTVGGTESRYTCNGVVDSSVDPKTNLERMLSSMAGTAVYTGGKWVIKAGAYYTPTITLDESHATGPITVQTKQPKAERCNRVKGTYRGSQNKYESSDFPAVTNATYLSEDNSEELWKDIDLPFTTSSSMAQRLAKIALEDSRQGITVDYPCNLAALPLIAGDNVMIDNTRLGWSAKPFRVLDWRFAIDDDLSLGINLTLKETAGTIWDWNGGEETVVDPAPNTNLPSPWYCAPVTGLSATVNTFWVDEGIAQYSIAVDFTASVTPGARYRIALIRAGDEESYRYVETPDTNYVFSDVRGGVIYHVWVVAVNRFGATSVTVMDAIGLQDWTDPTYNPEQQTTPDDVTGLQVVGGGTTWYGIDCPIEWDSSSQYFVAGYEVRIYSDAGLSNLLRTANVPSTYTTGMTGTPHYTYTFAQNKADTTGSPVATLYIRVVAYDRYGNTSSTPAALTASNPAPANPSGLTGYGYMGSAQFNWTASVEQDHHHYEYRFQVESEGWGGWVSTDGVSCLRLLTETEESTYTNATVYVEVRDVDVFGQQSTASASNQDCDSLYVPPTSIDDFADISAGWPTIPVPVGDVWTDSGNYASWNSHTVYYDGTGHTITAGNSSAEAGTDGVIVYWRPAVPGVYSVSDGPPVGVTDEYYIVAVVDSTGNAIKVWTAMANAIIGSAYIRDAAIGNAKISDVSASKLSAGSITVAVSITGTGKLTISAADGIYFDSSGGCVFEKGGSLIFQDVANRIFVEMDGGGTYLNLYPDGYNAGLQLGTATDQWNTITLRADNDITIGAGDDLVLNGLYDVIIQSTAGFCKMQTDMELTEGEAIYLMDGTARRAYLYQSGYYTYFQPYPAASTHRLYLGTASDPYQYVFLNATYTQVGGDLLPLTSGGSGYCGNSTYYWDRVYADYVRYKNLLAFDVYDDLALLDNIKTVRNQETGMDELNVDDFPDEFFDRDPKTGDVSREFKDAGNFISFGICALRQLNKEVTEDVMQGLNDTIELLAGRVKDLEDRTNGARTEITA